MSAARQPMALYIGFNDSSATAGRVRYLYVPEECDGRGLRVRSLSRKSSTTNPPQWRITLATIDATGAAATAYIDETYTLADSGVVYLAFDIYPGTLQAGMNKLTIYNVGSAVSATFQPLILECTP